MSDIAAYLNNLADELESWAQNEEMIDEHFTGHGKICLQSAVQLRWWARVREATDGGED